VIYFDTSYIVRLYVEDPGWQKVRKIAATDHVACCLLGQAEALAAFHRKFREGAFTHDVLGVLLGQFRRECSIGAFSWLPFSNIVIAGLHKTYANLAKSLHLRAGDAVHLACAAENGFKEIYSHNRQLLAASSHFGLRGIDLIENIG
jgi:predicted nucleic acid-binding protein